MFTLTRLELRNFGSIPHAVIEPSPTGITALDGPTGTGKSSALNAMVWCLYSQIGGVASFNKQADLRFDLAPAGEPVEVTVDFRFAGQTYKAVRRLHRSKSGKEEAKAEWWVDGVAQLNMSPDRLTEAVTTLTGLSGKSFVSSFFLPQQHLLKLANGTPAEVQQVIEEQTGLSPLTSRITAAKDEARKAVSLSDATPGSAADVDAAQSRLDEVVAAGTDVTQRFATAEAVAEAAHDRHAAARSTLDGMLDRQRQVQSARDRLVAAEATLSSVQRSEADLQTQLESLPSAFATGQLQSERSELQQMLAAFDSAVAIMNNAARIHAEAAAKLPSPWPQVPDDLTSKVSKGRHLFESLTADLAGVRARITDTQQRRLSFTTVGGQCPCCMQEVDDPAHVLAQYDSILKALTEQLQAIGVRLTDVGQRLDERIAELDQTTRLVEAAEQLKARVDESNAEHEMARSQVTAVTRAIGDAEFANDIEVRERLAQIDQQIAQSDLVVQVKSRLAGTRSAVMAASVDVEAARAAVREVGAFNDDDLASARESESRASQAREQAQAAMSAIVADAARATAATQYAQQALADAKARLSAKAAAVESAATKQHATAVLVEQRKELLAAYCEVISDAASRIMEMVGGGRHVGVHLDAQFTPAVILADGRRRPFRNCSGGEKLRAALCLCLGQVELISGGDGSGMMFADEIATGFDPETTAAVLEVMVSLGRPIVLIGHNPEVPQLASKVISFRNPGDRGTVVTVSDSASSTRNQDVDVVEDE